MKGIAHFAVGVAVATFFPEIVHDAAQSLAFGPVLGGIAGLLPDTLDFKLLRYLQRPDEVIDPAKGFVRVSNRGRNLRSGIPQRHTPDTR